MISHRELNVGDDLKIVKSLSRTLIVVLNGSVPTTYTYTGVDSIVKILGKEV
ncbi:unnamed protein product, partial [marine sediment metagenome]